MEYSQTIPIDFVNEIIPIVQFIAYYRKMTRMQRRFGVYCSVDPTITVTHDSIAPQTRRIRRRLAMSGITCTSEPKRSDFSSISRVKGPSSKNNPIFTHEDMEDGETHACDESNDCTSTQYRSRQFISSEPKLRSARISTHKNFGMVNSAEMIEADKNERLESVFGGKILYLRPSTSDTIERRARKRQEREIRIETYIRARFAYQCREAETRLEKSLIICTIYDSIKEKGGKFLKESSCNEGAYYEVDDWCLIKTIEEVLSCNHSLTPTTANSVRQCRKKKNAQQSFLTSSLSNFSFTSSENSSLETSYATLPKSPIVKPSSITPQKTIVPSSISFYKSSSTAQPATSFINDTSQSSHSFRVQKLKEKLISIQTKYHYQKSVKLRKTIVLNAV